MALAMPLLGCLESMIQRAETVKDNEQLLTAFLDRAASEIVVLTALCRAFTNATARNAEGEEMVHEQLALAGPALDILRRSWDQIALSASRWSFNDVSTG